MAKKKMIQITLLRSPVGCKPKHRQTVKALGLRKIGQTVEQEDNAVIRGMANKVSYLISVSEAE